MTDEPSAWWATLPTDREVAMDAIARRVTGLASEVHELQRRRRVAQRESSDVSGIDVELAHLTEELGEAMEMLVFA